MKRKIMAICAVVLALALVLLMQLPVTSDAAKTCLIVAADSDSDAILQEWNTGEYDYISLEADAVLHLSGQKVTIDLAGHSLSVDGTGTICAFDTANDTYDHLQCGIITAGENVSCEKSVLAPNGNRYVALTSGAYTTMHRVEMQIKTVSLRTSTAGLYYNAIYQCDRQVEE
ncbi:MAG: hypothetical protein J6Q54_02880 [Oscillospiraceae bacterium]|nr:hypothetical protein [Oscillospiraceae bacterium]